MHVKFNILLLKSITTNILSSIILCYWKTNLGFYKKIYEYVNKKNFSYTLKWKKNAALRRKQNNKYNRKKEIYLEIYVEFAF